MAKAETEIATLKAMQAEMRSSIDRGFSEQRAAIEHAFSEHRAAMERGFSEERAARERGLRWAIGISLTNLALILSIFTRVLGLL